MIRAGRRARRRRAVPPYREAGVADRASHWLAVGADEALVGNGFEAAIRCADAAEAIGDGPELGKVCAVRAIAQLWRGADPEAVVDAQRALDQLTAGSADWFQVAGYALLAAARGANKVWSRRSSGGYARSTLPSATRAPSPNASSTSFVSPFSSTRLATRPTWRRRSRCCRRSTPSTTASTSTRA